MTEIAVDICGGDHGCAPVLLGARRALAEDSSLYLHLFGTDEALATAENSSSFTTDQRKRIKLHSCASSVAMEDKPIQVLRNKSDSSMARTLAAVKSGTARAAVSCGNTSALVALGLQQLDTLEGVERPAICTAMPSHEGRTWFLDMGANLEPTLEQMLVNARLGAAQCRLVEGLAAPRVGIMNVGSEGGKGTRLEWRLAECLEGEQGIEFAGFAEGEDLFSGEFDLIVCDGFTGNVALKTAEGMARYIKVELRDLFHRHWSARFFMALTRRTLRQFRDHMDPANYNGAALLGLNGLVIKSHGSSTSAGIGHAIGYASRLASLDCVPYLQAALPRGGS